MNESLESTAPFNAAEEVRLIYEAFTRDHVRVMLRSMIVAEIIRQEHDPVEYRVGMIYGHVHRWCLPTRIGDKAALAHSSGRPVSEVIADEVRETVGSRPSFGLKPIEKKESDGE